MKATKAIFFGHDHKNSARITYKELDFNYGIKTGVTISSTWNMGGIIYTPHSNGQYTAKEVPFYKI